jgi:hypothetical protein
MPTSVASSTKTGPQAADPAAQQRSFRNADFMKIMLAEITQQDPFKPQETSKIVEGMQKLQDLANSTFKAYRDDLQWAQNLIGREVSAQEMNLSQAEIKDLKGRGLNPAVGYKTVTGKVTNFRSVDEKVYVSIGGKDYTIGSVKQVNPEKPGGEDLLGLASGALGRNVTYWGEDPTKVTNGQATAISRGTDGVVYLTVGGKNVPVDHITRIAI